jgi:hypothetical protein
MTARNNHPRDFYKFHRVITEADNALQEHRSPSRGAVMNGKDAPLRHLPHPSKRRVTIPLSTAFI